MMKSCGAGEELNLEAMNGTDIPSNGWFEIGFKHGVTKGTRVPHRWLQCYRRNSQSTQ